jgi:hypothetical protein
MNPLQNPLNADDSEIAFGANNNIFPEEVFNLTLNLYGKDVLISLRDVVLLSEGIKFELRFLSGKTVDQLDKILEKLSAYNWVIITAVEQLSEKIFDCERELDYHYSTLREQTYSVIMEERLQQCDNGKRTKSTVGSISNSDIDSYINSHHQNHIYFEKKKTYQLLKMQKEKLEKLETVLVNRSKEIMSILNRRTIKTQ